jgi:hypothetical protein
LVVQGLTLRPLLLLLNAHDDISLDEEHRKARAELAAAALLALENAHEDDARLLKPLLLAQRDDAVAQAQGRSGTAALRWEILARRRARLIALRRERAIGDHVFHLLEEELDHHELTLPPVPAGGGA